MQLTEEKLSELLIAAKWLLAHTALRHGLKITPISKYDSNFAASDNDAVFSLETEAASLELRLMCLIFHFAFLPNVSYFVADLKQNS